MLGTTYSMHTLHVVSTIRWLVRWGKGPRNVATNDEAYWCLDNASSKHSEYPT